MEEKRYAVIESGVVTNVVAVDDENLEKYAEAIEGELVQSDTACIGDLYDGGEFVKPKKQEEE